MAALRFMIIACRLQSRLILSTRLRRIMLTIPRCHLRVDPRIVHRSHLLPQLLNLLPSVWTTALHLLGQRDIESGKRNP